MARMYCYRCKDTGRRTDRATACWDADRHDEHVHAGTRTASVLG